MLLPSRNGGPDESDCRCSSATASWATRSRCCTDWSAAWAACLRFTAILACSHANAASARRWLASAVRCASSWADCAALVRSSCASASRAWSRWR